MMAKSRRVVFVCCDGLGRDWVRPETTPVLDDIRGASQWCAEHNAVFPSVTRVSADVRGRAETREVIGAIVHLIDNPETELSTVIRKNVERAELDAYLKGILFSLGRGKGF